MIAQELSATADLVSIKMGSSLTRFSRIINQRYAMVSPWLRTKKRYAITHAIGTRISRFGNFSKVAKADTRNNTTN